jgi:hypothetical protein
MARKYSSSTDFVQAIISNLGSATSPYTLAGWFNDAGTGAAYGSLIIPQAGPGIWPKNNQTMSYYDSGGHLDPAPTGFVNNTWNHAAQVGDGSASQGYLNGATNGATFGTGTLAPLTTASITWTTGTDTANDNLVGSTADIAIWQAALTASEIKALSLGARPNTIRSTALLLWWPLDGLQSPEPDLSGNAHNGTVNGAAAPAFGPPIAPFTPRWPQLLAAPLFTLMPQIVT